MYLDINRETISEIWGLTFTVLADFSKKCTYKEYIFIKTWKKNGCITEEMQREWSMGFDVRPIWVQALDHHLLAAWNWSKYETSLSFNSFISKIELAILTS